MEIVASIVLIGILALTIFTIVYSTFMADKFSNILNKNAEIKSIKMYKEIFEDYDKFENGLNSFIENVISDYRAVNVEIFSSDYLTDADQEKIRNDVLKMIDGSMSDSYKYFLTTIYKKENLASIIKRKVTIALVNIVLEVNSQSK